MNAQAQAGLVQFPGVSHGLGRDRHRPDAQLVAVIEGRGPAQGQQQHGRHPGLGLADPRGDAGAVVVAQNPVGPGAGGQGGVGVRRVRLGTVRPEDQGVPRVLALEGAGEHDAGGHLGFEVLQGVDCEIDPVVEQGLVDFLGEQALAADIGQPGAGGLGGIPGGADHVFLEHLHAAQHRAEGGEQSEEVPGLPQRQRRATGADAQR